MANVLFARLRREVKLVVYWHGYVGEKFSQSFTLMDEAGNILDETPTTECELTDQEINTSTVFFYPILSHAGCYHVNIYQNGVCTKTMPLPVIDSQ